MAESVEMYLITAARICEATGKEFVSLSRLAQALSLQAVSVHQMIRKIVKQGLVQYVPYKGIRLTPAGWTLARRVLRRRLLWQVFLVEHLGMLPKEADAFSCRLEHITPDEVAERLAEFLGHPTVSPLGDPIPAPQGKAPSPSLPRLNDLEAGEWGQVVRIQGEPATRLFFAEQGILPGSRLMVLALSEDGNVLVQNETGKHINLAKIMAENIIIKPVQRDDKPNPNPQSSKHSTSQEENPMKNQLPLSELPVGKRGVVVKVLAKGALKRRLLDMGLTTGEEVQVEGVAPLGDPIEFVVRGYHLSLRKREAAEIVVEVQDEHDEQ